jgi:probable F420-dependent oxidoreductase
MIATLDQLSGGRVVLGVGAGWMREEIKALGGPVDSRGAWTNEAIEVLRACWGPGLSSYDGAFLRFDEIGVFPQPAQERIPILVGGHSRAALRRTAALGDGWHAVDLPVEELQERLEQLAVECSALGRDVAALEISLRATISIDGCSSTPTEAMLTGSVDSIAERLAAYRDAGVVSVVLEPRVDRWEAHRETCARVASEIAPRIV